MSKTKSPKQPAVTAAPIYDEAVKALGHDPLEGWVRPPEPADLPVNGTVAVIVEPEWAKQLIGAKSAPAT